MSTCGTRCSNISPALFSKPVFSEPQWKCGLPAVDFTGWLNAAAFWECPWSWKSFWEIPTNQQGQFPDLFICFLLRLSYNAPTAKRWIYKKTKKTKSVQFPEVKVIFSQLLSIRQCWEWFRTVWMCSVKSFQQEPHTAYHIYFVFMNEFQRCSCA